MNTQNTPMRLSHEEITKLSSDYLQYGRKHESWQIDDILIDGKKLTAQVSMTSKYISDTDSNGFHLTIFSTLEFLSQLMIIYAHNWAGMTEKKQEGWMVESSTKIKSPIRDASSILINMDIEKIKKRNQNLYCLASYTITDKTGGCFEARLKGFLS
ncbi:MAG: hypothetical protein OIF57_06355 [Marinobacterium sp.]|nr:hypothetical protein [Marinobacterium sp.]